ncbi:MAG: mechanosensitive ion channel family protein [Erysipelotrichaceae bacterium]|nr:mechanosensitive ion channel family protein [Erysipelotrichaceae bacterium]
MKNHAFKTIACISAVLITTVLLCFPLRSITTRFSKYYTDRVVTQFDDFSETIESALLKENISKNEFNTSVSKGMEIVKAMLRDDFDGDEFKGKWLYKDGMVVKYADGVLELPETNGQGVPPITADDIKNFNGIFYSRIVTEQQNYNVYVNIDRIKGDYYYVDWGEEDEFDAFYSTSSRIYTIFNTFESEYNCLLNVVDEKGTEKYISAPLRQIKEAGTLDLDTEDGDYVIINEVLYVHRILHSKNTDWKIDAYINVNNSRVEGMQWIGVFVSLTLVIVITMIVWNLAVQNLVKNHVLSESQERRYNPAAVERYNIIAGILAVLFVFLCSLFAYNMNTMRKDIERGANSLKIIKNGLFEDDLLNGFEIDEKLQWYVYYGQKISELIESSTYPISKEKLQELKEIIGMQYLTLYDEYGKEICSSADYIDIELGTSQEDPTTDFRRLLHGVDHIIKEPLLDSFTGLSTQFIGIRTTMKDSGKYGALLMAFDDYLYYSGIEDNVTERTNALPSKDDILFMVGKDTGLIEYSSRSQYEYMHLSDLGIDFENRVNNQMNIYSIAGNRYYVQSSDVILDRWFCYYLSADSNSFVSAARNCLIIAGFFLVVYVLGISIITRGYDQKYFEENVLTGAPPISGGVMKIMLNDGRYKQTKDVSERFSFVPRFWNSMLPEQKALIVFDFLVAIQIIVIFSRINSGYDSNNDYLFSYIMRGQWNKGFNLYAFFSIALLTAVIVLGMIFIRSVLLILSMVTDTKGETVLRLLYNGLKYVALIVFLYYAFGYLGFDTRGILASVGLITLAISLGSKDLVADIVAGLTIVFEGEFQVGDMVDIDGYRGQVQEIGVRSTKVIGRGNNVKIIGNHEVKNVINLTRNNSWIPLEIRIPVDQPLDDVEKILEEELPKITKKIPAILSGPYYYGILGFDKGSVRLSILTECNEEDYHSIERSLYKELYKLLKKNKIMIG